MAAAGGSFQTAPLVTDDSFFSMESPRKQRTIGTSASVAGFGYWSGRDVTVEFRPAEPGTGIVFVRRDLPGAPRVPARIGYRVDQPRRTSLECGPARVDMIEHVMAALHGMGIDNCRVEVDGPEIPILDGSAAPFVCLIQEAGVRQLPVGKRYLLIEQAVEIRDGDKVARLDPADSFSIDFTADFNHPLISNQSFRVALSDRTFEREVARARTFCFLRDIEMMKKAGLATRVKLVPGSYESDPLPAGADLAWVSAIVHQNSREQNRSLFLKIFAALQPGGTIIIGPGTDVIAGEGKILTAGGGPFNAKCELYSRAHNDDPTASPDFEGSDPATLIANHVFAPNETVSGSGTVVLTTLYSEPYPAPAYFDINSINTLAEGDYTDFNFSITSIEWVPDVGDPVPIYVPSAAPVADFVGSPLSGPAPLTVDFTDLSTNTPTAWSWNFGDSETSIDQDPTHVYDSPGTYTVALTAGTMLGVGGPSRSSAAARVRRRCKCRPPQPVRQAARPRGR